MSDQSKPSIVFCHGIWADGSCFCKLIPPLQAEGYEVIAAQYGLDTLAGDVATVKRTLGRVGRPAILVGHSYGGTSSRPRGPTIASPGSSTSPRWPRTPARRRRASSTSSPRRIFAPHRGRGRPHLAEAPASSTSRATSPRRSRRSSGRRTSRPPPTSSTRRSKAPRGGRSRAGTSWPRTTAPCSRSSSASSRSAWGPRPEVDTSHVPMLSQPELVLDVIRSAANAVQGSAAAAVV